MKTIALFKDRFSVYCLVLLWMSVIATASHSQTASTGMLTGEVVESGSGAPMAGVTIKAVLQSDTSFVRFTYSNVQGRYRFGDLQSGTYNVSFSELGYTSVTSTAQVVGAEPTTLKIELSEEALHSEDVVVTASRHEEKVTSAPASVSIIPNSALREHVNSTPTEALTAVPGMDVAKEGIAMSTYASRSMHSVFGSDVLTMNDYHSLEVPAIGGFYGLLVPQIPDDIERVEVVRGPGSALYGPDAATGVVHFISKSPFASQGTTLSVSGGERDYLDGSFRHAQALSDRFAVKISGRYLSAKDWQIASDSEETKARAAAQTQLPLTTGATHDSLARIGSRDTNLQLFNLEARADAILGDDMTLNLTGGLTRIINDIALTEDFGGAQIKNWQYEFAQARWAWKDLFVQADINHNDTKDSYFLPTGAKISDHSTTYNVQLQDRYDGWKNEELTYGVDYRAIRPNTDSTLYGPEDGHANESIYGAYLQSQTKLLDNSLELVLAARVDKLSDQFDQVKNPIFSPRAAAVYHINDENLVRAMYNETYLFPSLNRTFADIVVSTDMYGVSALGIPATTGRYVSPYVSGLHFQQNALGSYDMYSEFGPRGTAIPSNMAASALWPALMQVAGGAAGQQLAGLGLGAYAQAVATVLGNIKAPTNEIASYLAYLNINPATRGTTPIIPTAAPLDISPVSPQHQRSFEIDYQGSMSKTFQFEVDAYQTHYTSIVATTVPLTPNVFLNSQDVAAYLSNAHLSDSLVAHGVPAQAAALIAAALPSSIASTAGTLPLGVVQPTGQPANEMHPNDLLIGSRGYLDNSVEFYGLDLQTEYKASDLWDFTFGGSWLNKNYWYPSELRPGTDSLLQNPFALNMPKYRVNISARYSGLARGLSLELRDRWSDAFKMYDNYYLYAGDIHARHVLDLTVNYRPDSPRWNNLLFTLSIQNLLDNVHQEFAGAPYIGRLTVLKASYILPPFWSPN